MKETTVFSWTRLLRTMVALLVVMAMLLCGCAGTGDKETEGKGNGNGNGNNSLLGGDGDGKLETGDIVGGVTGIYGSLLESLGGNSNMPTGYEMDMTVTVGETLLSQLGAALESQGMSGDMSWFQSLGLSMAVTYKDNLGGMNVSASINGTEVVALEAVVDMLTGMVYMCVPDLSDEYVGVATDMSGMINSYQQILTQMEEYADIVSALPTEKELNTLLTRYVDIAKGAMREPSTTTQTLSHGGISQEVTTTSYAISRMDVLNIAEAVLNTAKTDADLEKILDKLSDWLNEQNATSGDETGAGPVPTDLHANIMSAAENALEGIADAKAGLESGDVENVDMLVFSIFTDDDKQVGFQLVTNNGLDTMQLCAYSLTSGENTALYVDVGGNNRLQGTGTNVGGKCNGNYSLVMQGREMMHIGVKDLDTKALENGELKGTFSLRFAEEMANEMGGMITSNMTIELGLNIGGGKSQISLALYNGEMLFFRVDLSTKALSGGNVRVPSNYVDVEDEDAVMEWVSDMDFDKILRNLRSAGVSSELVDMLETALDNAMNG